LSNLLLAEPLACLVADHERRVDEHDSIAVCGCAVHPGDGLLDASLPASVQNPPVCVDDRHAGLVSH
jgi:hypothetical protein